MGKRAKAAAKQGKKGQQQKPKQSKKHKQQKSKRFKHPRKRRKVPPDQYWSDAAGRYLYPFEVPFKKLLKKHQIAAGLVCNLFFPGRSTQASIDAWWDVQCRHVPLDVFQKPLEDVELQRLQNLKALGFIWEDATAAGFELLHKALKGLLPLAVVNENCETEETWTTFINRCEGRRPSVQLHTGKLLYWDILCPQKRIWGVCSCESTCPFALNLEELSFHPANLHLDKRSWATSLSLQSFLGSGMQAVQSPDLLACNCQWEGYVVTALRFTPASPVVEVTVRFTTPVGPGRSAKTLTRFVVFDLLESWERNCANLLMQLPGTAFHLTLKKDPYPKTYPEFRECLFHIFGKKLDKVRQALSSHHSTAATISLDRQWALSTADPDLIFLKIFKFLGLSDFCILQQCCSQFIQLDKTWNYGCWSVTRSSACRSTCLFARALTACQRGKERGGSWLSRRYHVARNKRRPQTEAFSGTEESHKKTKTEPSIQNLNIKLKSMTLTDSCSHELRHLHNEIKQMFGLFVKTFGSDSCSIYRELTKIDKLLIGINTSRLVISSEHFRRHLNRQGLPQCVLLFLKWLERFEADDFEEVATNALSLLADLAFTYSRQPRCGPRMLLGANTSSLCSTFAFFAYHEFPTAQLLRLLASLVYNCDESKLCLAAVGGVDVILAAMVRHRYCTEVFLAGITALVNLTFAQGSAKKRAWGYVPHASEICSYRLCEELFNYESFAFPNRVVPLLRQPGITAILEQEAGPTIFRHLYIEASDVSGLKKKVTLALDWWESLGFLRNDRACFEVFFFGPYAIFSELQKLGRQLFQEFGFVRFGSLVSSSRKRKVGRGTLAIWIHPSCFKQLAKESFRGPATGMTSSSPSAAPSPPDVTLLNGFKLFQKDDNMPCKQTVVVIADCLNRLRQLAAASESNLQEKVLSSGGSELPLPEHEFHYITPRDWDLSQQIREELDAAASSCDLCAQDLAPCLAVLASPSDQFWSNILDLTSPRFEHIQINSVRFLQSSVSSKFMHGPHRGQQITDLVRDLQSGKTHPSNLNVEVIKWHGKYRTLCHRRLWALKQWQASLQHDVLFKVRVLPLVHGCANFLARDVVSDFVRKATSTNDGHDVEILG